MSDLAPIQSPLLCALPGVRHAFFTREGGVSAGVWAGLNVGRGSKDDPAAVAENRRRAAAWFGQPVERLVVNYQVHSATVTLIEEEAHVASPPGQADGVATHLPQVICGALAADCAPVLLCDPEARAVAAVHAGWKGALAGVTDRAIAALRHDFDAEASRIVAVVGPCIGPESYDVGEDFLRTFETQDPESGRFFHPGRTADKRRFDLPAYVLDRLARAGVTQAEWTGHDTYADPQRFFSNRRALHEGAPDYGRLLSAIMLDPA